MLKTKNNTSKLKANDKLNLSGKEQTFSYVAVSFDGGEGTAKDVAAVATLPEVLTGLSKLGLTDNFLARAIVKGVTALNYSEARVSCIKASEGFAGAARRTAKIFVDSGMPYNGTIYTDEAVLVKILLDGAEAASQK